MSITPLYLESQKLDYHYYAGLPTLVSGYAQVLLYFTCFSCTLFLIAPVLNPDQVKFDRLFSKP